MPDNCPKCSATLDADANFCPSCSTPVNLQCPKCAKPVSPDGKFCKYCAFDLTQEVSVGDVEESFTEPTSQPHTPKPQYTGVDALLAEKFSAMSDIQLLIMLKGDLSAQTPKMLSIALAELEARPKIDWRDINIAKTRINEAIADANKAKGLGPLPISHFSLLPSPISHHSLLNEDMNGKTSVGLKPNVAAVLSYALVLITGIISYSVIIILVGQKIEENLGGRPITTAGVIIVVIISAIISAIITMGAGFIFFLVEKDSRFVRLHTMQAILFCIPWFVLPIIFSVVIAAFAGTPTTKDGQAVSVVIAFLLNTTVSLIFFAIWILLMVKAYKGDMLKMPIISDMAENIVTK